MRHYLSSVEAAELLGISRQTLYAYVSRGLLHAHSGSDPRERKYLKEDVERLSGRKARGRKPKEVAKATLSWGLPVLESGLTLIEDGRLYYRGIDAVTLAADSTVEDVAALLWQCDAADAFGADAPAMPTYFAQLQQEFAGRRPETSLLPLFSLANGDDIGTQWQWQAGRRHASCGALVRRLAACLLGTPASADPIDVQCARAWQLDDAGRTKVRQALILCADHELNASGFTARCIASTDASLQATLVGGLAALSGPRHGGTTARVEALLDELGNTDLPASIDARLARGEELPGFGHHLYPRGDVRATAILAALLPTHPDWVAIINHTAAQTGHLPALDMALVGLRRHLKLPPGAAFGIFALGRSLGWIAHALEQRATGSLIRPRAAYTGVQPEPVDGQVDDAK